MRYTLDKVKELKYGEAQKYVNYMTTKTYTQKQYDNAKKRAYKKGLEAGYEGLDIITNDALESAQQVKDWKKWEQFDFDWTLIALVEVCLGVLVTIIF